MADNLSEIPKGSLSLPRHTDTTPSNGAGQEERESPAAPSKDRPAKASRARKQAARAAASAPAPADPATAAVLAEAETVVAAYVAASGRPMVNGTRKALIDQAAEHLDAGYPATWLVDRAREMASKGWLDLREHVARSKVPLPGQREQRPDNAPAPRAYCGECQNGFVYQDRVLMLGPSKCPCRSPQQSTAR